MPRTSAAKTKFFVLDTNVLMHDPTSLFHFQEHDVYLPMVTLEELDNHKKGMSEVARNARQASRFLDELVSRVPRRIDGRGHLLKGHGNGASGKLFLQTDGFDDPVPSGLAGNKADNQILGVVVHLQKLQPKRQVMLVTKDINMRIKAHALGDAGRRLFHRQSAGRYRSAL